MTTEAISVGNRVRSYDFPDLEKWKLDRPGCFIEGTVLAIGPIPSIGSGSGLFYTIHVDRIVWEGRERPVRASQRVQYAPLNGRPCSLGGVCNGVVRIDARKEQ